MLHPENMTEELYEPLTLGLHALNEMLVAYGSKPMRSLHV